MMSLRIPPARLRGLIALLALTVLLCAIVMLLALTGSQYFPAWRSIYLPLHSFMELSAVVIAMMVFGVGWHQPHRSWAVLILTSAFFAAAWLDAGHMLSFPGMPDFVTPSSGQKSLAFWLSARLVTAVAMVVYALCTLMGWKRIGNRYLILGLFSAVVLLVYWGILFHTEKLPLSLAANQTSIAFRLAVEYLIIGTYALAALCLLPLALFTDRPRVSYLLMTALILALTEVIVVVFDQAGDAYKLVGHAYKVIAYLFLYWAIFVDSVREPYQQLKRSQQSLAFSESKFRSLIEFAPDAVLLMDDSGHISTMNQMAETMFGLKRSDTAGVDGRRLVPDPEAGQANTEVLCQRMSGAWFPAEVSRGEIPFTYGRTTTMVVVRDISERKRLQRALVDQLTHDALTGLPNRTLIISKLHEALAQAKISSDRVVVHFLDVDFFKKINDTFGHSHGNEVLRICVQRLSALLPEGDTLARHGGDEFIIVQNKVDQMDQASDMADRLLDAMRKPFAIRGQDVFLSASIGLVVYPDDDKTEDGLLQKANVAMGSAKEEGRDTYCFYTPDMDQSLRERLQIEGYLHNAVDNQELLLEYQPKISFTTGAVVGVEALLRWRHPKLGLVPPDRFIPVAEHSGLIASIGMWVLNEACSQVGKWQAQGLPPLQMSVNLSARQFQQPDLPGQICQVLQTTGLDPTLLELELTESTVMRDTGAAVIALESLNKLGLSLSIDDFGTGYSSLSYLKQFPIHVLKIDRAFIKDVMTNPDDAAIVRAIVALAHGMELAVVAEGVETLEQAQFLHAHGCDHMQGYYFSRPLPPDEFRERYLQGFPGHLPH
ncbi:MAG: EAL domain-containing protein [Burkholderiaceae bacterium]|nr:EAL domain-containing protein [Burkholderiaceae bacterium]